MVEGTFDDLRRNLRRSQSVGEMLKDDGGYALVSGRWSLEQLLLSAKLRSRRGVFEVQCQWTGSM